MKQTIPELYLYYTWTSNFLPRRTFSESRTCYYAPYSLLHGRKHGKFQTEAGSRNELARHAEIGHVNVVIIPISVVKCGCICVYNMQPIVRMSCSLRYAIFAHIRVNAVFMRVHEVNMWVDAVNMRVHVVYMQVHTVYNIIVECFF
jgi:hypothetical protein